MQAIILQKSEEHLWEQFIKTHPQNSIFQSTHWARFQEKIPSRGKYWILVLKEKNRILAGTILIRQSLPKGFSWLYASRGPLIAYKEPKKAQTQMNALTELAKKIAKKEKAIFLRIDPPLTIPVKFENFRQNRKGFQPDHTLILDIAQSENDIFKQMKPKGRYNIRLAEKKGVKTKILAYGDAQNLQSGIDAFYGILCETTARDGFTPHPKSYYETMLGELRDTSALFIAEFQGEPIAGLIATFYNDTATYYYGASSNKHRNVMAPYLLQWRAISEARARDCRFYDFLGIAPANEQAHPWRGVTEFKEKFGGAKVSYMEAQEKPFRPLLYLAYRIYKFLRK